MTFLDLKMPKNVIFSVSSLFQSVILQLAQPYSLFINFNLAPSHLQNRQNGKRKRVSSIYC